MNQNNSHSKNHASGPGSAHLRYAMFGARGPLLDEHNDGSASGGSGATTTPPAGDGGTTTATPPSAGGTTTTTAPAGARVTFSPEQQAEVNRIAASAREDGRRAVAPRPAPTTAPAAPTGDAPKPTVESLAARLEESEMRREFDKRAAKTTLSDDAADDLFDLYKSQRPGDRDAWFASKQERFGFKSLAAGSTVTTPTVAAPAAAQTTAAPEAPRSPAAAPSAPAGQALPTSHGVPDIFAMTPSQHQQLGPEGIRTTLEALWKIGNQMNGAPQRPKPPSRQ